MLSPESEEGHTGALCLAPFGESHIPTHFHTYPRSTCKFWWHSGAPGVISPSERLSVGPGWSTPLDFSARGSTNVLFHRFRFVWSMDTCKTRCYTLWHMLASGSAAAGQFTLNVQEPLKCCRPKVWKVTPVSHAFHHLVNNNFQHTETHILGPLASFGGIPVLRG